MKGLAPFWRYYGGKNRAARLYPGPEHATIVEPFAGAAGYSCLHYRRNVVLVDRSPIIAGVWRYLIAVKPSEVLRIPDIPDGGTADDLPAWVPQEARWLAGFWCNDGAAAPCKQPSGFAKSTRPGIRGWGSKARNRIALQVGSIRHWRIIEGDYQDAPDIQATWFVDPPYNNKAGSHYKYQPESFAALGQWCRDRKGLVMVCENEGADWLSFESFASIQANPSKNGGKVSREVIWTNRAARLTSSGQVLLFGGAR